MTRIALLAATAAAALPAFAQAVPPDPERGQALAEHWCVACHVVGPDIQGGDAGPAFPTLAKTRTDEELMNWIADPHPPMPKLDVSGTDLEDIAAYIRTLGTCEANC